ncbi:MAG: SRPBCC domain-containing protein [Pseudomonadota bacterium]
MTVRTSYENGVLTVTQTFDAPRQAVFDAWVETAKTQTWWGCGDTTAVKSEIEPKVGGKYVHHMTIKHEHETCVDGRLVAFDPPALLAYETPSAELGVTMTVRVAFVEIAANKTEVTLTHTNIPDAFGDIVTGGWSAAFGKLRTFVEAPASAA